MIRGFNYYIIACLFYFSSASAQSIFDAARKGDVARIEFLHKLNPDTINSLNESKFTPLIIAVYRNQNEAAKYLLKLGALVDTKSPEGAAILAACYKNNLEAAELLLKYKTEINSVNEEGTTALMYAAMNNHIELIKLLLQNGANKSITNKYGQTALGYARQYNYQEAIELLK